MTHVSASEVQNPPIAPVSEADAPSPEHTVDPPTPLPSSSRSHWRVERDRRNGELLAEVSDSQISK